MPVGPDDAAKGSKKVQKIVAALQVAIDKGLLEEGDSFVLFESDLKRVGLSVEEINGRVLEVIRNTYVGLGWKDALLRRSEYFEGCKAAFDCRFTRG